MSDLLDTELKLEIEKISNDIKSIIKKINSIYPLEKERPKQSEPDSSEKKSEH